MTARIRAGRILSKKRGRAPGGLGFGEAHATELDAAVDVRGAPSNRRRELSMRLLAAVVWGVLLALSFPPTDIGWLAPLGVAALCANVTSAGLRQAALLGALAGVAFFGLLVSWSAIFGWVAWAALVLSQAAFMGLLGAGLSLAGRAHPFALRVLGIAGLWAVTEMLRSRFPLGGFPWGLLGASQHSFSPARASAAWIGTFGVSALVAAEGALLWLALRRVRAGWRAVVSPALALGTLVGLQIAALATPPEVMGHPIRVAIVQAGVEPGTVPADQEQGINEAEHLRLTAEAAAFSPDLIVWGEDVLDLGEGQPAHLLSTLASRLRVPILAGYVRDVPGRRFENVVELYESDGGAIARYVKRRPVPFGEYVPLRRVLGGFPPLRKVPRDMVRGPGGTLLRLPGGGALGSLISFESAFPDLGQNLVRQGAEILVVNTNNASFRRSPLARQHLAIDQMRAAEQGRYVIRAAITGISAVIDTRGRIVSSLPLFEKGILRGEVRARTGQTPYARIGDAPVVALGLMAALGAAWAGHREPTRGGAR